MVIFDKHIAVCRDIFLMKKQKKKHGNYKKLNCFSFILLRFQYSISLCQQIKPTKIICYDLLWSYQLVIFIGKKLNVAIDDRFKTQTSSFWKLCNTANFLLDKQNEYAKFLI